jgi:hypothetical protein
MSGYGQAREEEAAKVPNESDQVAVALNGNRVPQPPALPSNCSGNATAMSPTPAIIAAVNLDTSHAVVPQVDFESKL